MLDWTLTAARPFLRGCPPHPSWTLTSEALQPPPTIDILLNCLDSAHHPSLPGSPPPQLGSDAPHRTAFQMLFSLLLGSNTSLANLFLLT